jgi:starch phosphorylase
MFIWELDKMGYFSGVNIEEVKNITFIENDNLNLTLSALQLSKKANAVSKTHLETINIIWKKYKNICEIISITNAQNYLYWHNKEMYSCIEGNKSSELSAIKKKGKKQLFEIVADQCGEIYEQEVLTIVFAKRFVGYKRADLLLHNMERFNRIVCNKSMPIQIIWAGKPYPMDYTAIGIFDKIVDLCKNYRNCCILTGYELKLSKTLKTGADIWLNVPRITHEASGTSGMSAAMNGAINLAIPDGWFPEYAIDNVNAFIIKPSDSSIPEHLQDKIDCESLYDKLENTVIPMYYNQPNEWNKIMINSMKDIIPKFDSNRMAFEYYDLLYK